MPDGFQYVTEENKMLKIKYRNTQIKSNCSETSNVCTPERNDFLVLNYLGLFENRKSINLEYPAPDPFFGKLSNDH